MKYRYLFAVLILSLILNSATIPQVSSLQTWETWSPDFSSQGVILTEAFEGYLYDPDIVHGGTLTVATPSDPPEQHQWNAGATASYDFLGSMGDYLTRTDPVSGGVVPWIAESWEISDDKLSYVVHLTEGVKFHDGTELTSEDVKWCFDFIMENKFTRMSNVWQILSHDKPTEIIDDYTLRFHLVEPYVSFPSKTLGNAYIYPKHIWEEIVARPDFDWLTYVPTLEEQVGCGPFKLVEYVPNSHYKFEAFEDYWHGRPYVDYFIRPIITSGDAELRALKRGEVDIFTGFLASEAIPGLIREEGIGLYLYNNPYMYHWGMNNYKWPFNVKEFRFALAHAIDKQYIVDKLLLGYGLPGTPGIEAPFYSFWFNPNVPATYYFDLDKAAQILDDLGWVDTDGDGVREGTGEHAGEPLAFDIGPPIYDPVRCRAAELLSTWFAEIGVDATVQYMEWATLWSKITQPLDSPTKIDTWLLGSSQGVDPSWMHTRLHSDNIPNPNYYGFMNAEYDELALLQGTQFDSTDRQASIWRMQEILAEECPLVVLYFRQSLSVYRTDNLTGWIKHFGAGMDHFWNYINVHVPVQPSTTYEIVLFEGWNLIGLPCTPEDPSIEVVLADILENVRSVWSYFRAGDAIDEIENIEEGDVCIIDIAFDTSLWDEYIPTTIVCMKELFRRGAKIILVSTYIEGPTAYEYLMGEVEPYSRYGAMYGVDYVYLGYIAGGETAVAALANDIKSVFSSDYYGTPISYIPLMVGINSASDIQLVLSTGPEYFYYYYIRQWHVPYGTPVSRIVDSEWKSYSPGAPSNLAEMVEDRGYWIYMERSDILTVRGIYSDEEGIVTEVETNPGTNCFIYSTDEYQIAVYVPSYLEVSTSYNKSKSDIDIYFKPNEILFGLLEIAPELGVKVKIPILGICIFFDLDLEIFGENKDDIIELEWLIHGVPSTLSIGEGDIGIYSISVPTESGTVSLESLSVGEWNYVASYDIYTVMEPTVVSLGLTTEDITVGPIELMR